MYAASIHLRGGRDFAVPQNVTPAAGCDAGEATEASPAHSLSGENEVVENGADDGADDRADDGNPGVAPVGATLALDRQDRVSDTGAEVTGRVDGVTGGATERVTDDDDDEGDAKRAEVGLGVTGDEDPQDQDGGADGLSEAVPTVGTDLGAGGENAELEGGVAVLVEVLLEGQPAQDGAGEGTKELGDDVDRDVGAGDGNVTRQGDVGVEHVGDDLGDRHRGVQVATGAERNVDAGEDRQAPSPVDEQPAAALALGLGQQVRSNDAATEEQQDRGAEELRPENLARGRDSRICGCREQCCEHVSLSFSDASSRRVTGVLSPPTVYRRTISARISFAGHITV